MAPVKLLITGVTGYIGGTILSHLLSTINSSSVDPCLKDVKISVLTRADSRAAYFSSTLNLTVHTMTSLDDTPAITSAAAQNDIVIQCTVGYHPSSAKAIIRGLAQRTAQKAQQNPHGPGVYYIHTDGTSNLADKPVSGTFSEPRTFSDRDRDIYEYLVTRDNAEPYSQRTAAIGVLESGIKEGVPTTIIMSPTVYGIGSGHFNRLSFQYPAQIRGALRDGYASYIGDGLGQWDFVHIQDLAVLYELVLADFVSGRCALPTGEQGVIFSATGNFEWKEVAEGIAKAGTELGVLPGSKLRSLTLEEAARKWVGVATQPVELGFASNSRTRAEVARDVLGWRPTRSKEDWWKAFKEEVEEVVKENSRGRAD